MHELILTHSLDLRLDDFDNSCSAYDKALELGEDYLIHLNYAITLLRNDEVERCRDHFNKFDKLFSALDESCQVDEDVKAQANALRVALHF
jgi:Bardet-Biedl syndrome 4 protein